MRPEDYNATLYFEAMDNSYEPVFFAGDILYVNPRETRPTHCQGFLLFDGNEFTYRELTIVPGSDPMRVRIGCRGLNRIEPREAPIDELKILGRVWGFYCGDPYKPIRGR